MPQLDPRDGASVFRIAYCGPALAGKTQSIAVVHEAALPGAVGAPTTLINRSLVTDRILECTFTPPSAPLVEGRPVRVVLVTCPGAVYYDSGRIAALEGADGVVFVADTQANRMEANRASRDRLDADAAGAGISLDRTPLVLQYNKRDLPAITPLEDLEAHLNPTRAPSFESVAWRGVGVFATLDACWSLVLARHGLERDFTAAALPPPWSEPPRRLTGPGASPAGGMDSRKTARSWWNLLRARLRGGD